MPTGERGIAIRGGQQESPRLAGFRGLSRGMRTTPGLLGGEESHRFSAQLIAFDGFS